MKRIGSIAGLAVLGLFVLLQLVRPGIPAKPASAELQAPPEVKRIFQQRCYSCHSDERRISWYDQLEPIYWYVRQDVIAAREHLDFSTLGAKPKAAQRAALFEAVSMIQLGAMPLSRFVRFHPQSRVTPQELATLKTYLNPWPAQPGLAAPIDTSAGAEPAPAQKRPASLDGVPPEPNGVPFDASFAGWKLVSVTERADNHTIRLILGNDTAMKAIDSGKLMPWPDGARLAKIAWQQQPGPDGLICAGRFIQVELMIKGAKRHGADGWGWGRWRGLDLKPYGSDAKFATECITCHLPVRGDDSVYTLPITKARLPRAEVVNNHAAEMPARLPNSPLGWGALSAFVDPREKTIAVLFGDDAAVKAARARGSNTARNGGRYPAGSTLALVTWNEREDPHWFGARIPDSLRWVEYVQVGSDGKAGAYRRYDESGGVGVAQAEVERRGNMIVDSGAAELP